MKLRKIFMQKIIPINLMLIMIFSLATIFETNKVEAYTQTKKIGINEFPESYKKYLKELSEAHPNWIFTAYYTDIEWSEFMNREISTHLKNTVINSSDDLWKCNCKKIASGYACASDGIIAYYADPRNFLNESGIFQFLEMTYNSESQTIEGVKGILKSTFMDTNVKVILNNEEKELHYSEIIMDAAKQSGISPYSIAIKIKQEVGWKGSSSVSGTYPGYEGYYNFFNYGAYDNGNAIENALKYAKEKGWNNQYIAIIEGSKLMANSYVNVGQNTAYFYKWDVVDDKSNGTFWHQYMTNIQDPSSQAKNLFNTYANNNILETSLNFLIPVYKNMPYSCKLPTSIDKNIESSYYIAGTGVNLRNGPSTENNAISILNKDEIVTVLEYNVGNNNGIDWARIQRENGTIGYVANKYLEQCNNIKKTKSVKIEGEFIISEPKISLSEIINTLEIKDYRIQKDDGTDIDINNLVTTGLKFSTNDKIYNIVCLGDVNGDNEVDSLDALKILKHDVGLIKLNNEFLKAADVNNDGNVDSLDALKILKYDVGTSNITI